MRAPWLLLLILVPRVCQAAIAEIPLPELQGSYSWHVNRATTVALPSRPTAVHSVSLRLNAISYPGVTCCLTSGDPWCYPSGSGMLAQMPPSWFVPVDTPNVPGVFEWTGAFVSVSGSTWDSLLDGEAEVSLVGPSIGIPECYTQVAASVTVTEAMLIVDADFNVPVRANTWGRIKGLYR